jgi:WD40 repeat protein
VRYKAFVSYNQAYRGLARALQDALYRFGTPWYERSGPRIFRDESGLAAGPDLWEILRAALDESEFFIYLASPESARGFWPRKEVEYWLDQRGPDRVLLALAKGEVRWDAGATSFDPELSDALPEPLLTAFPHMPLFVDFRAIPAPTWRLTDPLFRDKVATIASALHGKSKDDLYGMQVSALIMSDAGRMARDAQGALAERLSDRALLLAAHALRLTEAHGEARSPEAEAALRLALARSGGRPLGDLDLAAQPAYSMSFDGRWLCTVATGDQVALWDLTGAERADFEPASICRLPPPSWVQLSRDGRWLVAVTLPSADDARTDVQLLDLCADPPERVALGHEGAVIQADVSPEGEFLALSTAAPPGVLVWHLPPRPDGDSGSTQPHAPSLVLDHHAAEVMRVSFSPAGATLCGFHGRDVAIWRLGSEEADVTCRTFQETAAIDACCVSPAGDTLLMLADKTPRVARLGPTGEPDRSVIEELNEDIVHRLEISPDGHWGLLLSESGPSYVVLLERPTEHGFTITSAGGTMNRHAFSRNGHWLATAAGPMERFPELQVEEPEFIVRLRSLLSSGLGEMPLAEHDDLITDVTFSPDGNRLVTCAVDRAIRIWDLSEMNALSDMLAQLRSSDPQELIRDFGFSERSLSQDLEEALARVEALLATAAGRLREQRPQVVLADDGAPLNCAFGGDGSWLLSAHFATPVRGSARLWDMRSISACAAPTRLSGAARIDNFAVNQTCALSADGRLLFVLGTCSLWELRTSAGRARDRPALQDTGGFEVERAEFGPGGRSLMLYAGDRLMLTSLGSDDAARALDTDGRSVRVAFFTGDGRWLVGTCGSDVAGDPADVRAWPVSDDPGGGSGFVAVAGSRTLRTPETSPRGRWLLVSDDDATRIWDLGRADPRDSERRLTGHRGPVASVRWSPDERSLVSAGTDGRLLCWPLLDGGEPEPDELHAADGPLGSLTAAWEGRRLFAGGSDGHAALLTLDPQLAVADRWQLPGLTGRVAGRFSPAGGWLGTWDDRAVRVFDVERRVERLELPHDPDAIHLGSAFRFSSDERWLVVSRQGRLFIVDMRADPGAPFIELHGHRHGVIDFRISGDAHWLVSVDRWLEEPEGYVPAQACRVWDLWSPIPADSGVTLPDMDLGVDRIELTPDDRWLVTSGRDGVRAWPLGTDHLLAVAQRIVGREPTEEERRRYSFTTFGGETG